MRHTVRSIAAVASIAALLLTSAESIAATKRIRAVGSPGSFAWEPTGRTIVKGDKIVWRNDTDYQHTVTAWKGRWSKDSRIEPGQRTSKVFKKTGVFRFRCTVGAGTNFAHSTVQDGKCSGMCGKVKVVSP